MSSETIRDLILPALGTLGTGIVTILSIVDVGSARKKYGVKAPDTEPKEDSPEEDKQAFRRAYRQYMNLIEWTTISQPIFWVSALVTREAYGAKSKPFKAVTYASAIFPIARYGYGIYHNYMFICIILYIYIYIYIYIHTIIYR